MPVDKPIILIGAGGHARVLAELIRSSGFVVHGVVDPSEDSAKLRLPEERFLATADDFLLQIDSSKFQFAMGIGARPLSLARKAVFERFFSLGFDFPALVHPTAHVASDVVLGPGTQVMAGSVIQSGSTLGLCTVANSRCSIDHECTVGDFAHISPGVILAGCVSIGIQSFIGPGSVVTENRTVGNCAVVGAGSVVLHDLPAGARAWGTPARTARTKGQE